MENIIPIIIGIFIFVGLIVFINYPAMDSKDTTTQDGLEDVVTDENTIYVKTHDKDRVKEKIIEGAPFDEPIDYNFVKKEESPVIKQPEATLNEHASEVIGVKKRQPRKRNKK